MAKKSSSKAPRDLAHLIAYDADGTVILEKKLDLSRYYEDLHPLIDSDEFRGKRGIRRVTGKLFDFAGALTQEFENEYAESGKIIRGSTRHEDGTITKFPP